MGRGTLLRGLAVVAVLNAVIPRIAALAASEGWPAAIDEALNRDMIVLIACAVGILLFAHPDRGRDGTGMGWMDAVAGGLIVAIILLPHKSAGWLALGAIGAYGLIACRRSLPQAAAASILLAVFLHEVVGRILVNTLTPQLALWDAALAAMALDAIGQPVIRHGAMIETGRGYDLIIVAGCLSFRAILQGVLVCFTFTRFVRPAWSWWEPATWGVLAVLLVGLNTFRLVMYSLDISYYQSLHSGDGRLLFGIGVLVLTLAVAAMGVRDELGFDFGRRRFGGADRR